MTTSKIGRRGQITLPRSVRQEFDLREGDRIAFVRRGNDIVLQPIRTTLRDHRGAVRVREPQDFEAIRTEVRRRRTTDLTGRGS